MRVTGDKRSCLIDKTGGLEAGDGERMEEVAARLLGLTVSSGKAKEGNGMTGAVVRFSEFFELGRESGAPKNKAENIFQALFHN